VVKVFEEFGVSTAIHYPAIDQDMPIYRDGAPSRTPIAARSVEEIYTLPCFPELRDEEVDRVINVFKEHIRAGQSS
jgi:dTDP-4-amino-4,6-dideoxygalactose transaminase